MRFSFGFFNTIFLFTSLAYPISSRANSALGTVVDAARSAGKTAGAADDARRLETARSRVESIKRVLLQSEKSLSGVGSESVNAISDWLTQLSKVTGKDVDTLATDPRVKSKLENMFRGGAPKNPLSEANNFAENMMPETSALDRLLAPKGGSASDAATSKSGHAAGDAGAALRQEARAPKLTVEQEMAQMRKTCLARKCSKAEQANIEHLQRLLDATPPRILQELGLDQPHLIDAFRRGIADSDFGKMLEGKVLLKEKSADSDLLLNFLRGDAGSGEAGKALREMMDSWPNMKGKNLLGNKLSNDEWRALFSDPKKGVLTGFFHEFPGMLKAVKQFNSEVAMAAGNPEKIAQLKEAFQLRISTNLFHNGIKAGFWKTIVDGTAPGGGLPAALKDHPQALEGTVFKKADGAYDYPPPQTATGVYHAIIDRVDQGTEGIPKILEELKPFDVPGPEQLRSLMTENPKLTDEQLVGLLAHVRNSSKPGPELKRDIAEARSFLESYLLEARSRVDKYASSMTGTNKPMYFSHTTDGVNTVNRTTPGAMTRITFDGGESMVAWPVSAERPYAELMAQKEAMLVKVEQIFGRQTVSPTSTTLTSDLEIPALVALRKKGTTGFYPSEFNK